LAGQWNKKFKTPFKHWVSGFKEGTLLDGTMIPVKNGSGRIKFGTESSGGFRNCTVANC
jgi:hypothetical protein